MSFLPKEGYHFNKFSRGGGGVSLPLCYQNLRDERIQPLPIEFSLKMTSYILLRVCHIHIGRKTLNLQVVKVLKGRRNEETTSLPVLT